MSGRDIIFPRQVDSEEVARLDSPEPVRLPLAKLVLDKCVSAVALLVAGPLAVLIAIADLAEGLLDADSRGPLFYHETRVSAGRPFRLTKFRIFKVRAIRELIDHGEIPKLVENDPANLTRVGRALKRTGLDEVPQYFNILTGEMSLVGPRPKPTAEYEAEIAAGYNRRKVMRAGLTGPAQLLKGTRRGFEDDLLADLRYIDFVRRSSGVAVLGLDLRILWRTAKLFFKFTGE